MRIKEGDEPHPHLHVFSLSDFRDAVGPKWERLNGLVEVAVESIIRRHVDSGQDIFTRLDAEISCLTLPNASRSETRTKVAAIAHDISAHLFGDAVIDGRRPQVLSANLPLNDALTEEGEMNRQAINHALAQAGAALSTDSTARSAGAAAAQDLAAPHRATLASLMSPEDAARIAAAQPGKGFAISGGETRRMEEPDWFIPSAPAPLQGADAPRQTLVQSTTLQGADATRQAAARAASHKALMADWFEVTPPHADQATPDQSSAHKAAGSERISMGATPGKAEPATPSWYGDAAPQRLNGADAERAVIRLDKAGGGPKPPETIISVDGGGWGGGASPLTPESSLTLVWTPTWVTSRRAIGAFHARLIRSDRDNSPTLEGVHAYDGLNPMETLTLDRFAATQSARELKNLFFSRQRLGLTVPVHWMSLSPKWRDCIRIPFEDCPSEARRRFLKIEVFGLSPEVPPIVLRRMFEPLERIGCDVLARLPLSAAAMIPALSQLRGVGVDLAELHDEERVGDDELFARLDLFRETARKAKIASYVWGVRRRPLIARLVKAGYSLVNGPGVMCDLSHPVLPSKGGTARPGAVTPPSGGARR
ncbi:hypothetical protein [Paramagnetospirillum marisnigri]|uniref:hypothetical protein n=1 Tax=Paramagnetospirillum marisnigri TaxID=1285242 RepID=UPI0012E716A8|nr:hypothetical protein [Paramagnetospirillum marisnigri]